MREPARVIETSSSGDETDLCCLTIMCYDDALQWVLVLVIDGVINIYMMILHGDNILALEVYKYILYNTHALNAIP